MKKKKIASNFKRQVYKSAWNNGISTEVFCVEGRSFSYDPPLLLGKDGHEGTLFHGHW